MLDLVGVLNGRLWLLRLEHYCYDVACCNGFSRSTTVARIVRLLLTVIFASAPSTPEIEKWSKYGPAIDKLVVPFCLHDLYTAVFTSAFQDRTPNSCASALTSSSSSVAGSEEAAFLEQLHWHRVQGARVECTLRFCSSEAEKVNLLILAIVVEPVRVLTR